MLLSSAILASSSLFAASYRPISAQFNGIGTQLFFGGLIAATHASLATATKYHKPLTWDEAAEAGRGFWDDLQATLQNPQHQDRDDEQKCLSKYTIVPTNEIINDDLTKNNLGGEMLANVGWFLEHRGGLPPAGKNFVHIKCLLPNQREATQIYQNVFSNGVIIATDNHNLRDERADTEKIPWSEAAFQGYKSVVGDVTDLRWIMRYSVNPEAEDLIKRARETFGVTEKDTMVFKPDDVDQRKREAFFVFLGSRNGRGAAFVLKDHKNALGRKNILRIVIPATSRNYETGDMPMPNMILAEVGPVQGP